MNKPIDNVLGFLESYRADLKYQYDQDGLDYVNYNSCETPCFETDAEFELYLSELEATIKVMGENR
tara:strand:+ start:315 stop:512 length:198 start_codon:yes stop_codon:yes gene_type:complete